VGEASAGAKLVLTDSPDCDGGFRLPSLPVLTQAATRLTGPRLTG
jgi:hypothetical protein